jgi:hypothetical protein
MKTLVIHPADRSTDFLKRIYEGKDWTIINDHQACRSRKVITNLIKKHDRIIMMGHGYPGGLFFTCINSNLVYLLREKECVCIWCNADQFVEKYGLRGFYTGMFISEVGEAYGRGIKIEQNRIDYSNDLFALVVHNRIDEPNILEETKRVYASNTSTGNCPVIKFNNERLYYRAENTPVDEKKAELLIF